MKHDPGGGPTTSEPGGRPTTSGPGGGAPDDGGIGGQADERPPRIIEAVIIFGAAFAASLVIAIAISAVAPQTPGTPSVLSAAGIAAQVAFLATLGGGVLLRAGSTGRLSVIRLRVPKTGAAKTVLFGLAAGVALQIVVLALLYASSRVIPGFDPKEASGPIEEAIRDAPPAAMIALVLISIALAPIAEELFFRGLLLSALEAHMPKVVAGGVSSALFATAHLNAFSFVSLFVVGSFLAAMVLRRSSLLPAIAAHVAFNTFAVAALLAS